MGDERLQTISLRIPEETYEKLKKYAEEHGSSVSDVMRELIDGLLSGAPGPSPTPEPPSPAPAPEPTPQPVVIPAEILELPEKVQAIMQYEIEMRSYVETMACRVGELQQEVKRLLMVVFPFMPLPPWAMLSALENPVIHELEKLAEKYYGDGA